MSVRFAPPDWALAMRAAGWPYDVAATLARYLGADRTVTMRGGLDAFYKPRLLRAGRVLKVTAAEVVAVEPDRPNGEPGEIRWRREDCERGTALASRPWPAPGEPWYDWGPTADGGTRGA